MKNKRLVWSFVFFVSLQAILWFPLQKIYAHFILDGSREIDAQIGANFLADNADVLLLGNSFLGEGVDVDLLNELSERRYFKAALPGSTTPTWYLILKNILPAADAHPDAVLIFFVDTHLTWPDYNIDGNYHLVKPYATLDEPTLWQHMFYDRVGPIEQAATSYLPTYRFRHDLQKSIKPAIAFWLPSLIGLDSMNVNYGEDFWSDTERRDQRLQNEIEMAQWPVDHLNFQMELPRSLLPAILDQAKLGNTQLIFVRMPRRRVLITGEPPELTSYIRDLQSFLTSSGAVLLDFSGMPGLTLDDFGVGDHLNHEGRILFTRLLAEKLDLIWRTGAPDD